MNKHFLCVTLALGLCSAGQAATTLSFPNLNNVLYNGSEPISPYAGSLGGQAVTLFCDDFNDAISIPATYQVNITADNASNLSLTRFVSTNYNSAYPTGSTLYEEMAWLFTQMMQPGQTTANQIAIQEAVWHMTASTPGAVSTTSLSNSGSNLTYLQWITDAGNDYNKTVSGFATPNYSSWMILTDVANASVKTQGTGNQELLAYYTSGSSITSAAATPEPGTIVTLATGLALLAAGLYRRDRAGKPRI